MSMTTKIRFLLIEKNMNLKELAQKLNTTSQNLNGKLSRDNFSEKELREIAEALDCDYEAYFIIKDSGKKI